jgi:hypothetical protein
MCRRSFQIYFSCLFLLLCLFSVPFAEAHEVVQPRKQSERAVHHNRILSSQKTFSSTTDTIPKPETKQAKVPAKDLSPFSVWLHLLGLLYGLALLVGIYYAVYWLIVAGIVVLFFVLIGESSLIYVIGLGLAALLLAVGGAFVAKGWVKLYDRIWRFIKGDKYDYPKMGRKGSVGLVILAALLLAAGLALYIGGIAAAVSLWLEFMELGGLLADYFIALAFAGAMSILGSLLGVKAVFLLRRYYNPKPDELR